MRHDGDARGTCGCRSAGLDITSRRDYSDAMPFVKLDCGMLDSTLWFERDAREVFITALLMAEPFEVITPAAQIEVRSLDLTGWLVPPEWYGIVPAAGIGIIARAQVDRELGLRALEQLGSPEVGSRSKEFDGRRLVRINGGYIVLNYFKYRDRDYTTAERSRRYRERKAEKSRRDVTESHRDITQAEAEYIQDQDPSRQVRAQGTGEAVESSVCPLKAKIDSSTELQVLGQFVGARERKAALALNYSPEFKRFWQAYPKKTGKGAAAKIFISACLPQIEAALEWQTQQPEWTRDAGKFIPHPATWLNQRRWEDEPFHPLAAQPPPARHDWMSECNRLHDFACGNESAHRVVMLRKAEAS